MEDTQLDATANSSLATEATADAPHIETQDAQPDSSTQSSVSSDSQTEISPEKSFADTVAKLEEGKSPKEAVKSETDTEAVNDEPAKADVKEPALSQEQNEALNKAFAERPEWKKVLAATPKEKQGEVRAAMRGIYERENSLHKQIEQNKPVLTAFDRFRKATGGEQEAENTIRLAELHKAGDMRAREMLVMLLNDFDSRTGAVLTSPDLLQRSQGIDKQVGEGALTPEDGEQRKKDLVEIQKARAGKQATEAELKQRDDTQRNNSAEAQTQEMVNACDAWEKDKLKSDPDYPALKKFSDSLAFQIGNERQQQLKGERLLNGREMKEVLEEAYKQAKEEAAKFRPAPKTRQVTTGTSSSATSRRQPANKAEEFDQMVEQLESRRR